MGRKPRFPKPDMARQLANLRTDWEPKEGEEQVVARFHRETESRRLSEVIDRLSEAGKISSDQESWAWRNFSAGANVDEIVAKLTGSGTDAAATTLSEFQASLADRLADAHELDRRRAEQDERIRAMLLRPREQRPRTPRPDDPEAQAVVSSEPPIAQSESHPPATVQVNDRGETTPVTSRIKREVTESRLPGAAGDAAPVLEPEPPDQEPAPVVQDWRSIIAHRILTEDYSFTALGDEAGVCTAVITRFVKGERDIRLETAQKLCAALDLVLVPRETLREEGE
jgi:hypothetical protein